MLVDQLNLIRYGTSQAGTFPEYERLEIFRSDDLTGELEVEPCWGFLKLNDNHYHFQLFVIFNFD